MIKLEYIESFWISSVYNYKFITTNYTNIALQDIS